MSYLEDICRITGRASPKDSPSTRQRIFKKQFNNKLIEMYTLIEKRETKEAGKVERELDELLKQIKDFTADDVLNGFDID